MPGRWTFWSLYCDTASFTAPLLKLSSLGSHGSSLSVCMSPSSCFSPSFLHVISFSGGLFHYTCLSDAGVPGAWSLDLSAFHVTYFHWILLPTHRTWITICTLVLPKSVPETCIFLRIYISLLNCPKGTSKVIASKIKISSNLWLCNLWAGPTIYRIT